MKTRIAFPGLPSLKRAAITATAWSVSVWVSGCGLFPSGSTVNESGNRITDFTLLGDSAIALELETWHRIDPTDTAPRPGRDFVLLDRRTGQLRTLEELPLSAAPTFPDWFFACESGRPVSVHPPGLSGPEGTCIDTARPAVTANGYRAIYADTAGTVHLFDVNLNEFEHLVTGARRVEVLDAAFGNLTASILEWHDRGDSALWRGFAIDDPSGSDSAWLVSPGEVRVHGEGTQLVCSAAEENEGLIPCWSPPGFNGFRETYAEAREAGIRPEWDPGTGVLAFLDAQGRFVFLNPASVGRTLFDPGPALGGYRP